VLPAVLGRLRHAFDLSARPDVIAAKLGQTEWLADDVAANPGLRVPGAFDGFELAVRAILGQQITVKGATTLAGRYVAALGEPIDTPHAGLTHTSPTADRVAAATVTELAKLGIIQSRAGSIIARSARRDHRATRRAARDWSVDRAVRRDARAPLAGCLSKGRHCVATEARGRDSGSRRGAVPGVAPVAQLRHAPSLAGRNAAGAVTGPPQGWRRAQRLH
jgi:hypothetical protein